MLVKGYLKLTELRQNLHNKTLEEVYENFYSISDSSDRQFMSFFEKIQIKSYSEAVAERVGSVMKISKGRNRNCETLNFNNETVLHS